MKSMGRWRAIIRERRLDSVQTSTTSPIKLRLVIISRRNWNSNDYSFFNSYAVNIYSCIHMNSCSSDPRQVPKKKLNLQKADGWEITTKPILDNLWSIPSTTTTQNSSSHRSFHSPSRLHSTYARRTDTLTSNKGAYASRTSCITAGPIDNERPPPSARVLQAGDCDSSPLTRIQVLACNVAPWFVRSCKM